MELYLKFIQLLENNAILIFFKATETDFKYFNFKFKVQDIFRYSQVQKFKVSKKKMTSY